MDAADGVDAADDARQGQVLADALKNASDATGSNVATGSAVMFGDSLDLSQCQRILNELARCELPFQCAHGRPTVAPMLALDALPSDVQAVEHSS